MSARPQHRRSEVFEFDEGYRRLVVSRGASGGLAPGYAASLIRERSRRDHYFRGRLADWYRRNEITASLGDDDKLLAALLRDVEAGRLQVSELDLPRPAYSHRYSTPVPPQPPAPAPTSDAIVDEARLLRITHCPAVFDPTRVALRISYVLRDLVGHPVELVIRSEIEPEPPVHRRLLTPVQTADGPGKLDWDGLDDRSGRRVQHNLAPFLVELVYDTIYRDEAKTTIAEPDYKVEFADLHFATDREILLPLAEEPGHEPNTPRARPLHVMAALLEFAADHPEREVVVYGHADTVGKAAPNDALSDRRARNIQLYLAGERDAWAAHCQEHYEIADFKRVHRWAADHFGWSTDPGALDNEWTSEARHARAEFRHRCDELLGTDLAQGVKQNIADWQAIFDLYDIAVAGYLQCEPQNLAALRAALKFADPAVVACGEHWPVAYSGQDNVAERVNRRVEVMFFQPGELPEEHGSDDPPGDELYASGRYRQIRLTPVGSDEALLRITLLDELGDRMPGASYQAETRAGPWVGVADADGVATIPRALVDTTILLEWTAADDDERRYWSRHSVTTDGETEQGLLRRLANLGFQQFSDPQLSIEMFQRFLGVPVTGKLEDVADLVNEWHVTGQRPQVNPDDYDWPETEPEVVDDEDDHGHED